MGVILEIAIKNRGGLLLIPQARPDMLEKGKKREYKGKRPRKKSKRRPSSKSHTILDDILAFKKMFATDLIFLQKTQEMKNF